MRRKVIQQGPATLVVSLPAKWVKKYNVQKGQEIEIAEKDNTLLLLLEPITHELKKEFNVDDFHGYFSKYLIHYFYQKGYDEVIIRYIDPTFSRIIADCVEGMVGFDIVEQGKNYTKIAALMSTDVAQFDTILRKAFLVTLEMGNKIIVSIQKTEHASLADIKRDERIINKYCDLCQRILNKKNENVVFLYLVVRDLEKLGDYYKYLCEHWNKNVHQDILELFISVHKYFQLYYELFYNFDKEHADRIFTEKTPLLQRCQERLIHANKDETLVLFDLMNIVQAVFDLKGPLFLMKI